MKNLHKILLKLLIVTTIMLMSNVSWATWTPSTVCSYSIAYSVPPTVPRDNRGLAVSNDGLYLYLGYNNGPLFSHVNLSTTTVVNSNTVDRAKNIAVDDQGRVYNTGPGGTTIKIYSSDLLTLLYSIPMSQCEGIAVTRESGTGNLYLYATERSLGTLSRYLLTESGINITGHALNGLGGAGFITITGGAGIRGVAIDPDGKIYIANPGGTIFKMNADGSGITTHTYTGVAPEPYYIAIIDGQLFVTQGDYNEPLNRGVAVINYADMSYVGSIIPPWVSLGIKTTDDEDAVSGIAAFPDNQGFYITFENGSAADDSFKEPVIKVSFPVPPTPVTNIELPTSTTCGEYDFDVTVQDFTSVGAISLILNYDPLVLAYQTPIGVTLNTAISSASTNVSIPGKFILGYNGSGSTVTLNDNDILFTLHFDLLPMSSGGTTNLTWSTVPGDCEYAGPNGIPVYNSTFNNLAWIIPVRPVKNIDTGLEYCKIQDAIDDANANDIIEVSAGTYNEDLVFNVSGIELRPKSGNAVTIKGVDTEPVANWPLANPNIEILANGVKIHGFTIQSPTYVSGYYSSGIVIGTANVEIYDNDFEVWAGDDAGGDEISQAIQTYFKGAMPGVDISGLNIHDNTFIPLNSGTQWGYEGIYVNLDEGTGTITIADNDFSGELVRAITVERSEATISGNTIITDLPPYASPGALEGISIRYAGPGGPFAQSNIAISGNEVKGSGTGKGFLRGVRLGISGQTLTGITVTGNTLSGNTIGALVRSSANGVLINTNNITGNTTGVINEDASNTLNAENNWWGHATGPYHNPNNTCGLGDPVSDNVDFMPWWEDAAMTISSGDLPVQNITTGSYYCKIQDAIDDINTTDGNEIQVALGSYTESLTINKELTINGIDKATRTLTGDHTITASNVTLTNFTFVPASPAITIDASAAAVSGVSITNSIFNLTSGGIGIWIGGSSPAFLVSNITISGNTFNGPADKIANPMKIGGYFGTGISCQVDNLDFTGNTVDKASIPLNLQDANLNDLLFDDNTFTNTDGLVYVWSQGTPTAVLSDFVFTNNTANSTNSYGVGIGLVSGSGSFSDANYGAGNMVNNNNFVNIPGAYGFKGVSILGATSYVLDATCNWWGSTNAYDVADDVSGNVQFLPYWTSATGPCNGLGPVVNTTQGTSFMTIQAAIDATTTTGGHIITVAAGIYPENVVVTKALSLRGANYGNSCGNHVGQESVVLGGTGIAFDIQSDGVGINGFEPHGMTAIRDYGYKDVAILNNQVQGDAVGIDIFNVVTTVTDGLDISFNCVDQSAQLVGGNPSVGIVLNTISGVQAAIVNSNRIRWPFYGYLVYNLNTNPVTTIQGASIAGVMQGIAAVNVDLATGTVYAPSTFNVSEISMTTFSGSAPALPSIDFHAGVYVYTGGSDAGAVITLNVSDVSVDGTDGHKQDCAGLYFADFSTVTSTMQNITVTECSLTNNENRGMYIRGLNALVDIDACTLDANGYDPYGLLGNDGFGIIVREGALATVDNCFITNPATVNAPYNVTALYTDRGTATNATLIAYENSLSQGGNTSSYLAGNPNGTLTATCCWWGSPCGNTIAPMITGTVTYSPWLVNGTDIGNPGFVPGGSCTGVLLTSVITGDATICYGFSTDLTITFTGTAPFIYSINSGTSVTATSNPEIVTVSPTATTVYTVTSLTDFYCTAGTADMTGSATVTVNPLPVLSSVSLQASIDAAGPPWDYLVSGNLSGGYSMCIIPSVTNYYLDINALASSPALGVGILNPFTLNTTSLPLNWLPYWAAKGVSTPPNTFPWQDQMWEIINGNDPFFYIKYTTGSDYILVDGLHYWLGGGEPILTVPGDYPNHTYTYTGDVTDVNGCISLPISVVMSFNACDITGTLKYNNTAQTGLNNMILTLNSTPAVLATSDAVGAYTLNSVPSGTYTITVNDNGKTAGGINATDAAQANYWGTTPWSIEKVRFFAGDVDNNNNVLAADAQQILAYFVNAGNPPYNFTPIWEFWLANDMISANPYSGPADPSVTIGSASTTQDLYGLCSGDFNQSFIPGTTKAASESLLLKEGKNIFAEVGTELELPIVAGMDMDVGAVSLILNFPSDKVEISDVFLTSDPSSSLMYNISGDELRIGWNSLIPVYLSEGESLITLKMKVISESGEEGISMSLVADPLNELADGNFFVINDAVLIADVIHTSALGIANNMADKLALANHPNPFKGTTNFVYSLPVDGRVILEIYDLVGNKVLTAVDEAQTAGEYTVKLETNRLQPGVYTATLRLSNEDSKLVRTIKILSR